MSKVNKNGQTEQGALPEDFDPFKACASTTEEGQLRVGAKLEKLRPMYFKDVKDYWWTHPDPEYTTPPMCFLKVPMPSGRTTLHPIGEDLLKGQGVANDQVERRKLILATRPNGALFLGILPYMNLDNEYNSDVVAAVEDEEYKNKWRKLSRYEDGRAGYIVTLALDQDFVNPPTWPTQTMQELVKIAFKGLFILKKNHPGLLRVTGQKQPVE
jgi:hypothetical protein